MDTAPVVVFTYNRPGHTGKTLEALASNDLANQSTLYIYADGPKYEASEHEAAQIQMVRKVVRSKQWCKEVNIIESPHNKGLADSIVDGVTEIVNRHGRVIVLEDDIVTTKGFLRYMNDALELYDTEERVMQISASMYDADFASEQDTFFLKVMSCQGWGTWKRAWSQYNNDAIDHLAYFKSDPIRIKEFDIEGNAHFFEQLRRNVSGELKTWAVRWYASWWRAGGMTLFPQKSLLRNIGFDNSGINSGRNDSYINPEVDYVNVVKVPVIESADIRKSVGKFWGEYLAHEQSNAHSSLRRQLSRILNPLSKLGRKIVRRIVIKLFPEMKSLFYAEDKLAWHNVVSVKSTCQVGNDVKLSHPHNIHYSIIGAYSYISHNGFISYTEIGKFCSIGPNFRCGWGIHPVKGLSTSPSFYSSAPPNGVAFCRFSKVQEREKITVGNDVFIGMNVTVLDGVTIGDGAVIGAGCVVTKDVPPYAIVAGNPMRVLRYRFTEEIIEKLQEISWWDWEIEKLHKIEGLFFDVKGFLSTFSSSS